MHPTATALGNLVKGLDPVLDVVEEAALVLIRAGEGLPSEASTLARSIDDAMLGMRKGNGAREQRDAPLPAGLRGILKDEENGIDRVLRSLQRLVRRHPQRTAISRVLRFFRKQRNRKRYAEFQQRGHPIGSGIVEAANRVLIAERLKCSGMRWSETAQDRRS